MKICTLCEENKNIEEFYLSKGKRISRCKDCRKSLSREYAIKNKERVKDYKKKWKSENSDKVKKYIKKYNSSYSSKLSKKKWNINNKNYYSDYYEKNKEGLSIYKKEWYSDNKENILLGRSEKYNNDVEYRENKKGYSNGYYLTHKDSEEYKLKKSKISLKWSKDNPHIIIWRGILRRTLKCFSLEKNNSTLELLGYNADDLRSHIESLFKDGMSWDNHGEWHIDHIFPLSKFDEDTHVSIVNSLENLQPLWAFDNLSKGNKIIEIDE